jgi:hypothetical protein
MTALLIDPDRALVFAQRGPANRLGLAVQLCALRFLGFVPEDLAGLPSGRWSSSRARSTPPRMS